MPTMAGTGARGTGVDEIEREHDADRAGVRTSAIHRRRTDTTPERCAVSRIMNDVNEMHDSGERTIREGRLHRIYSLGAVRQQQLGSKAMRIFLALFVASTLAACGTMSTIESPTAEGTEIPIDLSNYDRVTVLDFSDATEDSNLPEFAGRNFADRIAAEVRGTAVFSEVSRDTLERSNLEGTTLVVSGDVTRYEEGNSTTRLLVGFGAGSSYFDAVVRFADSESGEVHGVLIVDRNSWALGGALAADQTVESFMIAAAERVAEELVKSKQLE